MPTKQRARLLLHEQIGPLSFGTFLRAARTSLGMTQVQMAENLKISKSMICDIEKGRQLVSPKLALNIAKKAKLSEKLAVKLCLQDQLTKADIKMRIDLVE